MNAKRMIMVTMALTLVLALSIGAVNAQNNPNGGNGGNGNGNGMGNGAANGGAGMGNGYRGGQNGNFSGVGGGSGLFYMLPEASVTELPQDIVDLMIAGWTDEQHAYAVYGAVMDQLGNLRPFTSIQRAEAQHISAWEMLLTRYGVEIPAAPTFDVPVLADRVAACTLGAEAEVANAGLYDTMFAAFEPYPDLLYVAQALSDASEFNHLPAFERCAGL